MTSQCPDTPVRFFSLLSKHMYSFIPKPFEMLSTHDVWPEAKAINELMFWKWLIWALLKEELFFFKNSIISVSLWEVENATEMIHFNETQNSPGRSVDYHFIQAILICQILLKLFKVQYIHSVIFFNNGSNDICNVKGVTHLNNPENYHSTLYSSFPSLL